MGSPIDRTAKTALDSNLVNGNISDAPKIKANNDTAYNYMDGLNAEQNAHTEAPTLPHADQSVTGPKIKDYTITETKYATGSVSARAIANGVLTADKFLPGALTNDTQNGLEIVSLKEDYVKFKKVYLTDYGLQGDDTFRTISSVFPSVTLSEVQALNPIATLANSADWYVIQKVINDAEGQSTIVVDGKFVIDLPLVVEKHHLTIKGKNRYRLFWSIKQIGDNQSLIKFKGSYQAIKDMLLTGTLSTYKSLHGIEIYGNNDGVSQSDHFHAENLYIQMFGGCGICSDTTHFILNKFKDIIVYNCFNDGIYFLHTPNTQMNGMTFENVSTYNNGLVYQNGEYKRIIAPTTDRGHGISISGTGITIIGGDSSANSSSGVYIHEGYYTEGMAIIGRYFEDNTLANFYSEARKPITLSGNYMYPALSQLGNVYYKYPLENLGVDIGYDMLNVLRHINKPIGTYTHTTNKEVFISSIDAASNAFTSVGHGLINGDSVYPMLNKNMTYSYTVDKFPSGLYSPDEGGFKVIEATANSFKISLTTGGTAIDVNATSDLSAWHFEANPTTDIYVANLTVPNSQKLKACLKGRFLTTAPAYMLPMGSEGIVQHWAASGKTTYDYPATQITGDLFLDLTIRLNSERYVSVNIEGVGVTSARFASQYTMQDISKHYVSFASIGAIAGLFLGQCYLANGTTVDIFLDT